MVEKLLDLAMISGVFVRVTECPQLSKFLSEMFQKISNESWAESFRNH